MSPGSSPGDDQFSHFGYWSQPPTINSPEAPSDISSCTEIDSSSFRFFCDMTPDQYNVASFGKGTHFDNNSWNPAPQFTGTPAAWKHPAGYFFPEAIPGYPNDTMDTMDFPGQLPWTPMESLQPAPTHTREPYQHHHYLPEAAAKLLNNRQHLRNNATRGPSQEKPRRASDFSLPQPAVGPPMGQVRHQALEEFLTGMWSDSSRNSKGTAPKKEANPLSTTITATTTETTTDFQWGSDSNFSTTGGYTRDASKDTIELMEKEKPAFPSFLEVSETPAGTRPGSSLPLHAPWPKHPRRWTQPVLPKAWMEVDTDLDTSPQKRRKTGTDGASSKESGKGNSSSSSSTSNNNNNNNSNSNNSNSNNSKSTAKTPRRRRPKAPGAAYPTPPRTEGSSSSRAGSKKHSKAAAGAVSRPRPVREGLTEAQKRENHIRSEHKRRKLIKDGFDDMCVLVPGLRAGEFSKSSMLTIAAKWLQELLAGNEDLKEQLADLEGA
ncbi:hypothetical protein ACO1O0_007918 [Amphichorda felina]